MSAQERKLQEAMFELVTSEASYLRSLNVLTTHFMQELSNDKVLSRLERSALFSYVLPVRACSEALLADLEKRLQGNIVITDISDILLQHVSKHFHVYIKYCSNQLTQKCHLIKFK